MGFLRRDGRLRPGTLWAVFVAALLLGAAAGWAWRWWSDRTIAERAVHATEQLRHSAEKAVK